MGVSLYCFACLSIVCGVVVLHLQCLEVAWPLTVLCFPWLAPSELYRCAPSELPGCVALWAAFVSATSEVLIYWIAGVPVLHLLVVGFHAF